MLHIVELLNNGHTHTHTHTHLSVCVSVTSGDGSKKMVIMLKNVLEEVNEYNWLFMPPRNLCILAKNDNLWIILFMRGSTWGMAIFTVDIHYANYICAISV